MFKNLKKQAEGFTIIEVMIVLVIAAVILLIVFLAVPALQRNSRNTQRKNDVAGVLAGIGEYTNNNGGTLPSGSDGITGASAASASVTFPTAIANTKLGFYQKSDVYWKGAAEVPLASNPANNTAHPTNLEVYVYLNETCSGTGAGVTKQNRSIAAVYQVESGSGGQMVCQSE